MFNFTNTIVVTSQMRLNVVTNIMLILKILIKSAEVKTCQKKVFSVAPIPTFMLNNKFIYIMDFSFASSKSPIAAYNASKYYFYYIFMHHIFSSTPFARVQIWYFFVWEKNVFFMKEFVSVELKKKKRYFISKKNIPSSLYKIWKIC